MRQARNLDAPDLPTLAPGVTLLETDGEATGPLQSLVLDHLLFHDGTALWADGRGDATTHLLARVAPSRRLLDRILVARGFTPYQHYAIVEDLHEHVDDDTALLIAPAVDHRYADEDLRDSEGQEMLAYTLDRLADLAAAHDLPVLATTATTGDRADQVAAWADRTVACTRTRFRPRFSGPEFETLVYRDGPHLQTTLAFWAQVLEARVEAAATLAGTAMAAEVGHGAD